MGTTNRGLCFFVDSQAVKFRLQSKLGKYSTFNLASMTNIDQMLNLNFSLYNTQQTSNLFLQKAICQI